MLKYVPKEPRVFRLNKLPKPGPCLTVTAAQEQHENIQYREILLLLQMVPWGLPEL